MALKVLLADDSMTAQKMGKEILLAAGYEVVTVSNGAAAVKKMASERPDVAVLDIYMPGYTGLEVCERIKSDPATARTPVVLTVGKMEAYNPQDGAKVKADGVIIKPFEATDLVATVQKLGEQAFTAAAAAPSEEPEYQKTLKINVKEFLDPSYADWKSTAEQHTDETMESGARPTHNIEVPQDMAAGPAYSMDEEPAAAPVAMEHPTVAEPQPTVIAAPPEPPPAEPAPVAMEMSTAPPPAPLVPARDPHLEPTSARDASEIAHAHDPMFEPTVRHDHIEVEHAVDPALITDPDQMNTEFKTKFGVENPEPISVGVAADIPELYGGVTPPIEEPPPTELASEAVTAIAPIEAPEAVTAVEVVETAPEAPPPAADMPPPAPPAEVAPPPEAVAATPPPAPQWVATAVTLEDHEHHVSLDDEMQKAFAAAAHAEPEPAPAVAAPPPAPEPAPVAEKQDLQLAAEMAAAIGAEEQPMAAGAAAESPADHERIMTAVHNVLERIKPDLIAQVKRELQDKK